MFRSSLDGQVEWQKDENSAGLGIRAQVITGQGKHSLHGKPRILPAVVSLLLKERLPFRGNPFNAGVVEVQLQMPTTGAER